MSVNKNIIQTVAVQAPNMLLALFVNFFITRTIGASGRGVYVVFASDTDFFSLFLSFTITSALVFFVANKKIALNKLLGLGIIVTALGTLVLSALLLGLYAWKLRSFILPDNYSEAYHYLYLIGCFVLVMFSSVISSVFQGYSRFDLVNRVTIINGLINFTVFATAFSLSEFGKIQVTVNWILLLTLVVFLINFCIWLILYRGHIGVAPVFRFEYTTEVRPLFIFMTLGHLAHIINFLTYRIDYWIIEYYRGVRELGYYAQAVGLAQLFWNVTTPITTVLIPYLSMEHTEKSRKAFLFFSRVNFTLIFVMCLAGFFIAPVVFPIYGSDFTASVLPYRILLPGILFSCLAKMVASYIYSMNKIQYNLYATIVGFAITIALDLLLIPSNGIVGASIASSVAYISIAVVSMLFLAFAFRIPVQKAIFISLADIRIVSDKLRKMTGMKPE